MRRALIGGTAATILLVLVAACGGGAASPSPSASTVPATTAPTTAPATAATATDSPAPSEPAPAVRLLAVCEGVAIRAEPSTTAGLLARVAKLTKVRVRETVVGEAYTAGSCGTSGSDWVKIDRINGTSVKKLYGVPFGYGAAGFFE